MATTPSMPPTQGAYINAPVPIPVPERARVHAHILVHICALPTNQENHHTQNLNLTVKDKKAKWPPRQACQQHKVQVHTGEHVQI